MKDVTNDPGTGRLIGAIDRYLRFALSRHSESAVVALHVVDLSEFVNKTDEDLTGAETARTEARAAAESVLRQAEQVG